MKLNAINLHSKTKTNAKLSRAKNSAKINPSLACQFKSKKNDELNLLVTGGCGFIGSSFIHHMLKKYPQYKITNLDALTYCGNLENLKDIENNPNYTFVHGNICDKKLAQKLVSKADCVVNFAAETHVDNSIENPEKFVETNVQGTQNLLEAARKNNIKKFVQISTDEVYGSLGEKGCFYETSPLAPSSPYSASKASADMLARAYYKTYDLPTVITRSSNNYGPYQYPEKLIPFFISKLLKNEKIPLYGDGLNVRDWLYVKDNCEAIDLVLHNGKIGEIYNIGGQSEKTNLEIARLILKALDKDETSIEFVKDRLGHDRRYALSCDKISSELGWKNKTKFEDGINSTIKWYLSNQDWIKNIENKRGVK